MILFSHVLKLLYPTETTKLFNIPAIFVVGYIPISKIKYFLVD